MTEVGTPAARAMVSTDVFGGTEISLPSTAIWSFTSSKPKRSRLFATMAAATIFGTYFAVSLGSAP